MDLAEQAGGVALSERGAAEYAARLRVFNYYVGQIAARAVRRQAARDETRRRAEQAVARINAEAVTACEGEKEAGQKPIFTGSSSFWISRSADEAPDKQEEAQAQTVTVHNGSSNARHIDDCGDISSGPLVQQQLIRLALPQPIVRQEFAKIRSEQAEAQRKLEKEEPRRKVEEDARGVAAEEEERLKEEENGRRASERAERLAVRRAIKEQKRRRRRAAAQRKAANDEDRRWDAGTARDRAGWIAWRKLRAFRVLELARGIYSLPRLVELGPLGPRRAMRAEAQARREAIAEYNRNKASIEALERAEAEERRKLIEDYDRKAADETCRRAKAAEARGQVRATEPQGRAAKRSRPEPKSELSGPAAKSEQPGPAVKSVHSGPVAKSEQSGPVAKSEQPGPAVKSVHSGPVAQSEQPGPAVKSVHSGPVAQSEQPGPAAQWGHSGPAAQSEQPGPAAQSEQPGPAAQSGRSRAKIKLGTTEVRGQAEVEEKNQRSVNQRPASKEKQALGSWLEELHKTSQDEKTLLGEALQIRVRLERMAQVLLKMHPPRQHRLKTLSETLRFLNDEGALPQDIYDLVRALRKEINDVVHGKIPVTLKSLGIYRSASDRVSGWILIHMAEYMDDNPREGARRGRGYRPRGRQRNPLLDAVTRAA
jgi:hypothetical protein